MLDAHLGDPLPGRPRLRARLMAFGLSRGAEDLVDPDVVSLLHLVGIDASDPARLAGEVARAIDMGTESGIGSEAVPTIVQAYARGVGRIVAAEASLIQGAVRSVDAERRAGMLASVLEALVPVGTRGFEVFHRALLREALVAELAEGRISADDPGSLTVAMVDLVGSTRHLKSIGAEELEELVDILFEAAQSATSSRAASVVKYVGDGVFIAGHETVEVAEVALDLVALLEVALPLRARGGVTRGAVVQRAGDIFGLPVNTAQILTKAARPGTVLADEPAAKQIPPALRTRPRVVALPHPALGAARVVTVRRS